MNNSNYFKDLFESNYRKIVLLKFSIQNEKILFKKIGFSKNDINLLKIEFKIILMELHEEHLDYVKNEEESIIERFLNK